LLHTKHTRQDSGPATFLFVVLKRLSLGCVFRLASLRRVVLGYVRLSAAPVAKRERWVRTKPHRK